MAMATYIEYNRLQQYEVLWYNPKIYSFLYRSTMEYHSKSLLGYNYKEWINRYCCDIRKFIEGT